MANHTDSVGFFAAEVLEKTAARQAAKNRDHREGGGTNVCARSISACRRWPRICNKEGIRQGDRVGVLLPNSTAIPLSYYATQKIGAVTVILDARLKGKELQGVLSDADLKLLIVHSQLFPEVEENFKTLTSIPIWIVNGDRRAQL